MSDDAVDKKYRIEIEAIELEITRYRLTDELVTTIYDVWRERKMITYDYQRLTPAESDVSLHSAVNYNAS